MMSFLHHDITMVITFYILNFNIILAIFDIIFKAVYITSILRAKKMHNTAYGPFVGFFNGCDHNYVLKSLSHKPSGVLC